MPRRARPCYDFYHAMELELPPECAAAYAVERQLAAGGFGTVYLARHRALDRLVALKLLNAPSLSDPDAVDRFVNEARITASLSHPHIVVLLDHGIERGVPWIAYEYLPATSLRTRMLRGPLPWREAFALAAQVCSALAAAHAAGVLHRDIKPENVLLVDDATCKVADFGTAKWASGRAVNTGDGVILGTPAYLAPELVAGIPAAPQSDVYALGAMLYEMLCGHVPFDAGTMAASLRDRLEYEPLPLGARIDGIPPEVDAAVLKAVARSRSDRYMTAQACHLALTALLEDAPSGTLAAFRRAAHAAAPEVRSGSSSGGHATVRTMIALPARRSTVVVPALEIKANRRAVLALTLATGVLAALAVFTRPDAPPVTSATPRPAPKALDPDAAAFADQQLDVLWVRAHRRVAREDALWAFLADLTEREPPPSAEQVRALMAETGEDVRAVDALADRLAGFAEPRPALAALSARLATLAFQLSARLEVCRLALSLPHGLENRTTALHRAPQQVGPKTMERLHAWLERFADALSLACATGTLDRRCGLLVDETYTTACYVSHELEHFPRAEVARAMTAASAAVSRLPLPPLAALGALVLSVWDQPIAARRGAIERARLLAAKLAVPLTRELGDTLRMRLGERKPDER